MAAKKRVDEASLRAHVAELKRQLAEAQEALNAAEGGTGPDDGPPIPGDLITEAQHALSLEQNLLRKVIDMIPDHVFVRDRAGRHVINNRAQLDQLRAATLEETIGKTDFEFYTPETAQRFKDVNDKVMSSGETLVTARRWGPGPDGEDPLVVDHQGAPPGRGRPVIGMVGISRDVTEQPERHSRRSSSRPRCSTRRTTPSSF